MRKPTEIKCTIKGFKKIYTGLLKQQNVDFLSSQEYRALCPEGYSPHYLKKELGLAYAKALKEIGAKGYVQGSRTGKSKISGKIHCIHSDRLISRDDCVPNINKLLCPTCKSRQDKNPASINEGGGEDFSMMGSPSQLAEDAAIYQGDL